MENVSEKCAKTKNKMNKSKMLTKVNSMFIYLFIYLFN